MNDLISELNLDEKARIKLYLAYIAYDKEIKDYYERILQDPYAESKSLRVLTVDGLTKGPGRNEKSKSVIYRILTEEEEKGKVESRIQITRKPGAPPKYYFATDSAIEEARIESIVTETVRSKGKEGEFKSTVEELLKKYSDVQNRALFFLSILEQIKERKFVDLANCVYTNIEETDRKQSSMVKGSRPFTEEDHSSFIGFDKQLYELNNAVEDNKLIIIRGPSGCGKTSLVRAGLIPKIKSSGATVITLKPENFLEPEGIFEKELGSQFKSGQTIEGYLNQIERQVKKLFIIIDDIEKGGLDIDTKKYSIMATVISDLLVSERVKILLINRDTEHSAVILDRFIEKIGNFYEESGSGRSFTKDVPHRYFPIDKSAKNAVGILKRYLEITNYRKRDDRDSIIEQFTNFLGGKDKFSMIYLQVLLSIIDRGTYNPANKVADLISQYYIDILNEKDFLKRDRLKILSTLVYGDVNNWMLSNDIKSKLYDEEGLDISVSYIEESLNELTREGILDSKKSGDFFEYHFTHDSLIEQFRGKLNSDLNENRQYHEHIKYALDNWKNSNSNDDLLSGYILDIALSRLEMMSEEEWEFVWTSMIIRDFEPSGYDAVKDNALDVFFDMALSAEGPEFHDNSLKSIYDIVAHISEGERYRFLDRVLNLNVIHDEDVVIALLVSMRDNGFKLNQQQLKIVLKKIRGDALNSRIKNVLVDLVDERGPDELLCILHERDTPLTTRLKLIERVSAIGGPKHIESLIKTLRPEFWDNYDRFDVEKSLGMKSIILLRRHKRSLMELSLEHIVKSENYNLRALKSVIHSNPADSFHQRMYVRMLGHTKDKACVDEILCLANNYNLKDHIVNEIKFILGLSKPEISSFLLDSGYLDLINSCGKTDYASFYENYEELYVSLHKKIHNNELYNDNVIRKDAGGVLEILGDLSFRYEIEYFGEIIRALSRIGGERGTNGLIAFLKKVEEGEFSQKILIATLGDHVFIEDNNLDPAILLEFYEKASSSMLSRFERKYVNSLKVKDRESFLQYLYDKLNDSDGLNPEMKNIYSCLFVKNCDDWSRIMEIVDHMGDDKLSLIEGMIGKPLNWQDFKSHILPFWRNDYYSVMLTQRGLVESMCVKPDDIQDIIDTIVEEEDNVKNQLLNAFFNPSISPAIADYGWDTVIESLLDYENLDKELEHDLYNMILLEPNNHKFVSAYNLNKVAYSLLDGNFSAAYTLGLKIIDHLQKNGELDENLKNKFVRLDFDIETLIGFLISDVPISVLTEIFKTKGLEMLIPLMGYDNGFSSTIVPRVYEILKQPGVLRESDYSMIFSQVVKTRPEYQHLFLKLLIGLDAERAVSSFMANMIITSNLISWVYNNSHLKENDYKNEFKNVIQSFIKESESVYRGKLNTDDLKILLDIETLNGKIEMPDSDILNYLYNRIIHKREFFNVISDFLSEQRMNDDWKDIILKSFIDYKSQGYLTGYNYETSKWFVEALRILDDGEWLCFLLLEHFDNKDALSDSFVECVRDNNLEDIFQTVYGDDKNKLERMKQW